MNDFLRRNRITVTITVFLLIVVPCFVFGIILVVNSIKEKASRVQSIKIDQAVSGDFLQSVAELRSARDRIDEKQENFTLFLRDDPAEKVALFQEIKSIARASGHTTVENEVVAYTPPVAAQDKTANPESSSSIAPVLEEHIVLHIKMVGTYQNFMDFVHKIEHFDYLNDILSVSLTAREPDEATPVFARSVRSDEDQDKDKRQNIVESELLIAFYLEATESQEGDEDEPEDVELQDESTL